MQHNEIRLYRLKSENLRNYLITKEGSILNTATGRWIQPDKFSPGIVYLEVDGHAIPYHVKALLDDIDLATPFKLNTSCKDKVNYYIVKDLKTNKTEIFRNREILGEKIFPNLDMELLDKYLLKGYSFNYQDRWLIINGQSSEQPTVSFTINDEDEIVIIDKKHKRIRSVSGEKLFQSAALLKENSYLVEEDKKASVETPPTYFGEDTSGYLSHEEVIRRRVFGYTTEDALKVKEQAEKPVLDQSHPDDYNDISQKLHEEQAKRAQELKEQLRGGVIMTTSTGEKL